MQGTRRFEETVRILDVRTRHRATTIRGKRGTILSTLGETKFSLLEVMGAEGQTFEIGERVDVSKESRKKIDSVLGRMSYESLSDGARRELPDMVGKIVGAEEERFVSFVNRAEPLAPRTHALELIPGVGKQILRAITEERAKEPFSSYADIEERTGFADPAGRIAAMITGEISGEARVNLFAKK